MRQRSWSTAEAARDVETKDVRWFGQSQDVPRTGWKAVVRHQGKTFFLLLAVWVVLVYYIRRVSKACVTMVKLGRGIAKQIIGTCSGTGIRRDRSQVGRSDNRQHYCASGKSTSIGTSI